MSSPFSYELDERQIRLLLQDSELAYDSSAWDKFEHSLLSQPKSNLSSFVPKINFAISRSVIVPFIFVILIGGLSAMLFSFVDFKKKDAKIKPTAIKEKEILLPLKQTAKATPIKIIPSAKVEIIKPIEVQTIPQPVAEVIKPVKKINLPVIEKSIVIKPKEIVLEKMTISAPKIKENTVSKKRKKVTSEEIPTINTSAAQLNSGNAEPEPELELK